MLMRFIHQAVAEQRRAVLIFCKEPISFCDYSMTVNIACMTPVVQGAEVKIEIIKEKPPDGGFVCGTPWGNRTLN